MDSVKIVYHPELHAYKIHIPAVQLVVKGDAANAPAIEESIKKFYLNAMKEVTSQIQYDSYDYIVNAKYKHFDDYHYYYNSSNVSNTTWDKKSNGKYGYHPGGLVGGTPTHPVYKLKEKFPDAFASKVIWPCDCRSGDGRLADIIQHLNDTHEWSRNKIADWLEEQDIDITIKENK